MLKKCTFFTGWLPLDHPLRPAFTSSLAQLGSNPMKVFQLLSSSFTFYRIRTTKLFHAQLTTFIQEHYDWQSVLLMEVFFFYESKHRMVPLHCHISLSFIAPNITRQRITVLTKSKFACCEPGQMKASNTLEMLKFTPCQGPRLYLKGAHETNRQDGDTELF